MQESFWDPWLEAWSQNFALVLLPILACLIAIAYFLYHIYKQKQLKDLKESGLFAVKQMSKLIAPRVRLKFRPFLGQGSHQFYRTGGSNIQDITGSLYLLSSEEEGHKPIPLETPETLKQLETLSNPQHNFIPSGKTETAVIIDWGTGKFAALRVRNLEPEETILSRLGFKSWYRIAKPSMTLLWIVVIGLTIYNIMLTIGMTQGYDPDFLIDTGMFGWYASFFLLLGAHFVRQYSQDGFFGDLWYNNTTYEDITLEKPKVATNIPDKVMKTHVPVYEIDFIYHDFISPGQYIDGLSAREILDNIDRGLNQRIAELSASNTNLITSFEQLQRLYEQKQIENSAMKDAIEMRYTEGVATGIKLANQTMSFAGGRFLSGDTILSVAKSLIPLCIFALIVWFIITNLPEAISNIHVDPVLGFLLALGALGLLLLGATLFILALREMLRGSKVF